MFPQLSNYRSSFLISLLYPKTIGSHDEHGELVRIYASQILFYVHIPFSNRITFLQQSMICLSTSYNIKLSCRKISGSYFYYITSTQHGTHNMLSNVANFATFRRKQFSLNYKILNFVFLTTLRKWRHCSRSSSLFQEQCLQQTSHTLTSQTGSTRRS